MNTFGIYFKRNKKAFTIIELIVVIAVIGILVLLAAPKFLNYTKKAQLVRIQNDTKAASTVVDAELTVSDSLAKWGEPVDIDLETLKNEKKVYTIEGLLTEDKNIESGPYWKINKSDFKSKLPGEFYANSGGMVYYVDTKSGSVEDNGGNQNGGNDGGGTTPTPEPTEAPTPTIAPGETNNTESTVKGPNEEEVPPGYTLLTDDEFEFIEDQYARNFYSVSSVNEGASTKGYFHYKGTADKVVIPHVIMGNDIKDYYNMFKGTVVIAVASNNPNVTNMDYMFYYSRATSLDLSSFDTSNVTSMYWMFGSSQATSIDLSNSNTANVTDMSGMFAASRATSIVGLDTSNVTNMDRMFISSQAKSITFGAKFNTSNVTNMKNMFARSQATSLDLSSFNTAKVTNMSWMFQESKAKSITFGAKFNTSNVTDMANMFQESQATSLDLSSFNTSNVTYMNNMFWKSQATTLDLSSFDTSNVTGMGAMFFGSQATTLDLSSFNTANVTSMFRMFSESQATMLDLSNFNTTKVTDMRYMFSGSQARSLDLSSFNTAKVNSMYMDYMFQESQAIEGFARTESDAYDFNRSNTRRPEGLTFRVK